MILDAVTEFRVSTLVIAATERALQRAGAEGFEMFVLWSGVVEGSSFLTKTPHVPKQTSYRRRGSLLVRVEGQALHDLNRWLYEHDEVLGVQVHAHPTDAFHSDTDDSYPIVTLRNGLSIVAADFARDGLLVDGTASFRLGESGWEAVDWRTTIVVEELT
jgi:hypothetical protein